MVGDGADTLFWHDLWLGGVSFRVRFSRLFELAVGKSCTVSYMSSYGWDVGGRVGGGEGYTVSNAYQLLTSQDSPQVDSVEALVWYIHVPIKVSIFAWRLLRDRLPTRTNLVHRGVLPGAAAGCLSGCGVIETSQHLFISVIFMALFGIRWYASKALFFAACSVVFYVDHME
ncbi:uncharacterized protein [Medicago truncatula]|uniref:uncharacterized protein n=1 Tax=Medicago truncatula TaxID=3880 RepID=UPI000D2F2F7D|nr:uncharacterized protein LOC112420917 [Medicago truncatula]